MSNITDELYNAIKLYNGCKRADINEAIGDEYNAKQISNALSRLVDAGRIERIREEGGVTYYAYPEQIPEAVPLKPAPVQIRPTVAVKKPEPSLQGDVGDETEHVGRGPEAAPSPTDPDPGGKIADLTNENMSLYALIADIRIAAGDDEGRLMQNELVEHIRNTDVYAADLEDKYRLLCQHIGIGYSYTPDELKQLLEALPSRATINTAMAIEHLQTVLGPHDPDATFGINADQAVIRCMGRKFDLPTIPAELDQFIESLNWIAGQWIEENAA